MTMRSGKVGQWGKALAAKPEDLSLVLGPYMEEGGTDIFVKKSICVTM